MMSDIYLMITIVRREYEEDYIDFFKKYEVHSQFGTLCNGTAQQKVLDYLGIEDSEKVMMQMVVSGDLSKRLLKKLVSEMGIDMPGSGIAITIPLDSIGGISSMRYLMEERTMQSEETIHINEMPYALIIAISERGSSDVVMEAARSAGAGGGTIIHAKGSESEFVSKFFGVSIADEKDMIYIVAKKRDKANIMKAIMERAGLSTKSRTIVFSLPVDSVAGLHSVMEE